MRYYAHYTFIYPDKFFTNHVLELDSDSYLISVYPFDKETSQTLFHSGIQVFIPDNLSVDISLDEIIRLKPELKNLYDESDVLIRRFRV